MANNDPNLNRGAKNDVARSSYFLQGEDYKKAEDDSYYP